MGTPLEGVGVDLTEDGLVRVRSRAVGLGYVTQDGADALEQGTFISGDLGRFDDGGRLILTGRAADVINIAGRKVTPGEIETCLLALDGVTAAASRTRFRVVIDPSCTTRGASIGPAVGMGQVALLLELPWSRRAAMGGAGYPSVATPYGNVSPWAGHSAQGRDNRPGTRAAQ